MSRLLLGLLMWASSCATAWACPVCFRMEEGPVTAGVRAAVVVLMTVTVAVLAGFAIFIRGFVRRAGALERRNPLIEPRNLLGEPRNLGTPELRNL